MMKTKHIETRMKQRGIAQDEIDMVLHPIYEAVNKDNAIKEETTND